MEEQNRTSGETRSAADGETTMESLLKRGRDAMPAEQTAEAERILSGLRDGQCYYSPALGTFVDSRAYYPIAETPGVYLSSIAPADVARKLIDCDLEAAWLLGEDGEPAGEIELSDADGRWYFDRRLKALAAGMAASGSWAEVDAIGYGDGDLAARRTLFSVVRPYLESEALPGPDASVEERRAAMFAALSRAAVDTEAWRVIDEIAAGMDPADAPLWTRAGSPARRLMAAAQSGWESSGGDPYRQMSRDLMRLLDDARAGAVEFMGETLDADEVFACATFAAGAIPASMVEDWMSGATIQEVCERYNERAEAARGSVAGSVTEAAREKRAFAVYCDSDKSLRFYRRAEVPQEGETIDGRTVDAVYTEQSFATVDEDGCPWSRHAHDVETVEVVDEGVAPESTSEWFSGFEALERCDLSRLDTTGVSDMSMMFEDCESLAGLDLSGIDTRNTTDMSWMFDGCRSLKSLDLSGFDTSKTSDMAGMFWGCSSLSSIDVSSFDTSRVEDMSCMFQECSSLPDLNLSGFDVSEAGNMRQMFYGCTALASLDIGGFRPVSAKDAELMFEGCDSLPAETRRALESKMAGIEKNGQEEQTFAVYCEDDKSLRFYNRAEVPQDGDVLEGRTADAVFSGEEFEDQLWDDYADDVETVEVVDEGIAPESTANWFAGFESMASCDLSKLDTGNVTDMGWMFDGCESLKELDLSGFDTRRVETMTSMFAGCSSLKSIDLSSLDTGKVRSMGSMFKGCAGLRSLDLSGFETGNVEVASWMFAGCESLAEIDLSGLDTSKVETMNAMFLDCSSLGSLDLSGFDTARVDDMDAMFAGCSSLAELDMSGIDASSAPSADDMFAGCDSLPAETARAIEAKIAGIEAAPVADAPQEKRAFAVYCDADKSLRFYNRAEVPLAGGRFEGRTVDEVYTGHSFTDGAMGAPLLRRRPWGHHDRDVETVEVVDEGIAPESTARWFSGFERMAFCDLSKLDTSRVTSMAAMFRDCSSLAALDLSGFDTSNVGDMNWMFRGCSSLESLDLSGFDTGNVKDMHTMFAYCSSLASLDLSGFDTGRVETMEGMFKDCAGLEELDLSDFDTGNVEDMSSMFEDCKSLTGLELSSFDTARVEDMHTMFADCSSLAALDLSGFETGNVEDMGDMFRRCWRLVSLDLSGFDTSRTENMAYMFADCKSLASLDLSGFDTGRVETTGGMFFGCTRLESLNLSGFDPVRVETISDMFYGCDSLPAETVRAIGAKIAGIEAPRAGEASQEKQAFAVYCDADKSLRFYNRAEVPQEGETVDGRTADAVYAAEAFDGHRWGAHADDVETVEVVDEDIAPESTAYWFHGFDRMTSCDLAKLDTGNVKEMGWTFYGCRALKELDLSGFDTGRATDMSNMFCDCTSLESLDLSGFDTGRVGSMAGMFLHCESLAAVDLSRFDTGNVGNMAWMFAACESLESLDLSSFDTARVESMEAMFRGCGRLTSLDLSSFDTRRVDEMDAMFDGCESLTGLDLASFDTARVETMHGMFADCSSLAALDLSGFETGNVEDMGYMFDGCSSLASLDLSGFDTSRVDDMDAMFYGCSSLEELDMSGLDASSAPSSDDMFAGCDSLPAETVRAIEAKIAGIELKPAAEAQQEKQAFAVYCDADKSLRFYNRAEVPQEGETIDGRTADAVYAAEGFAAPPWRAHARDIHAVEVVDEGIAPESTAYWFSGFDHMTACELSKLDTSRVKTMLWMFNGCKSLEKLDLSGFDTGNAANMSFMFANCENLQTLDLSGFDTSRADTMSWMFFRCSSLEELDLSVLDTSRVGEMKHMFDGCSSLKELDLSSFDVPSVEAVQHLLDHCDSLPMETILAFESKVAAAKGGAQEEKGPASPVREAEPIGAEEPKPSHFTEGQDIPSFSAAAIASQIAGLLNATESRRSDLGEAAYSRSIAAAETILRAVGIEMRRDAAKGAWTCVAPDGTVSGSQARSAALAATEALDGAERAWAAEAGVALTSDMKVADAQGAQAVLDEEGLAQLISFDRARALVDGILAEMGVAVERFGNAAGAYVRPTSLTARAAAAAEEWIALHVPAEAGRYPEGWAAARRAATGFLNARTLGVTGEGASDTEMRAALAEAARFADGAVKVGSDPNVIGANELARTLERAAEGAPLTPADSDFEPPAVQERRPAEDTARKADLGFETSAVREGAFLVHDFGEPNRACAARLVEDAYTASGWSWEVETLSFSGEAWEAVDICYVDEAESPLAAIGLANGVVYGADPIGMDEYRALPRAQEAPAVDRGEITRAVERLNAAEKAFQLAQSRLGSTNRLDRHGMNDDEDEAREMLDDADWDAYIAAFDDHGDALAALTAAGGTPIFDPEAREWSAIEEGDVDGALAAARRADGALQEIADNAKALYSRESGRIEESALETLEPETLEAVSALQANLAGARGVCARAGEPLWRVAWGSELRAHRPRPGEATTRADATSAWTTGKPGELSYSAQTPSGEAICGGTVSASEVGRWEATGAADAEGAQGYRIGTFDDIDDAVVAIMGDAARFGVEADTVGIERAATKAGDELLEEASGIDGAGKAPAAAVIASAARAEDPAASVRLAACAYELRSLAGGETASTLAARAARLVAREIAVGIASPGARARVADLSRGGDAEETAAEALAAAFPDALGGAERGVGSVRALYDERDYAGERAEEMRPAWGEVLAAYGLDPADLPFEAYLAACRDNALAGALHAMEARAASRGGAAVSDGGPIPAMAHGPKACREAVSRIVDEDGEYVVEGRDGSRTRVRASAADEPFELSRKLHCVGAVGPARLASGARWAADPAGDRMALRAMLTSDEPALEVTAERGDDGAWSAEARAIDPVTGEMVPVGQPAWGLADRDAAREWCEDAAWRLGFGLSADAGGWAQAAASVERARLPLYRASQGARALDLSIAALEQRAQGFPADGRGWAMRTANGRMIGSTSLDSLFEGADVLSIDEDEDGMTATLLEDGERFEAEIRLSPSEASDWDECEPPCVGPWAATSGEPLQWSLGACPAEAELTSTEAHGRIAAKASAEAGGTWSATVTDAGREVARVRGLASAEQARQICEMSSFRLGGAVCTAAAYQFSEASAKVEAAVAGTLADFSLAPGIDGESLLADWARESRGADPEDATVLEAAAALGPMAAYSADRARPAVQEAGRTVEAVREGAAAAGIARARSLVVARAASIGAAVSMMAAGPTGAAVAYRDLAFAPAADGTWTVMKEASDGSFSPFEAGWRPGALSLDERAASAEVAQMELASPAECAAGRWAGAGEWLAARVREAVPAGTAPQELSAACSRGGSLARAARAAEARMWACAASDVSACRAPSREGAVRSWRPVVEAWAEQADVEIAAEEAERIACELARQAAMRDIQAARAAAQALARRDLLPDLEAIAPRDGAEREWEVRPASAEERRARVRREADDAFQCTLVAGTALSMAAAIGPLVESRAAGLAGIATAGAAAASASATAAPVIDPALLAAPDDPGAFSRGTI